MKNTLRFGGVALLLLFAIGCGSFGKDFDTDMVKEIKNRQTSKTEVLDWFGVPFKEGNENGLEMWTYQYDQYSMGKTESKDLVILFDNTGVVKAYRFTSSFDDK